MKVTIVPRGQSLGAAWYLPEERSISTTDQILDQICSALGGRAAEQITFDKISTGALSDLEKVTKQAYAMVSIFGLNKRLGNISFYDSQGRDMFTKPYSDDTAKIIDEEVSKLIEEQYQRAIRILKENEVKLKELADRLLSKEVIFKEDLESIFGKRPWDPDDEEKQIDGDKETGVRTDEVALDNEVEVSTKNNIEKENSKKKPEDSADKPTD